nr:hypothetical protein [Armatimonas sp.]
MACGWHRRARRDCSTGTLTVVLAHTGEGDSKTMHKGSVTVKPGLGALANTIIDTHFFVRQRTQRLLNMVFSQPPGTRGIGVDENAWCEIEGKQLHVRSGQVLLLTRNPDGLPLKILDAGTSTFLP